jgi:DNA polymerase-3 subunit gamma/tau
MLYQEIRPNSFDDVVGNRSVVKLLQGLVKRDSKDRPHSIMLSGPKGCGKTTLARILATEFGTKEDNIQELNTANVRGIDTAREIISTLNQIPFGGGSVTYIFDEAHRITKDAMEALLKDTEETPEHVYFIFCTTEPTKIIPTLKDRFTEYKVEKLKISDIIKILERACEVKTLNVSKEVLEVIACNCDQTPRTSLVLLEKIQDISDPNELVEVLASEIMVQESGDFIDLCKLLILAPEKRMKRWKDILIEYEKLDQDIEQIRIGIMGFMRKQLMRVNPTDLDYAKDLTRIMDILSQSTFYSGKHSLAGMLMKICL